MEEGNIMFKKNEPGIIRNGRFEVVHKESLAADGEGKVIRDKETGVLYYFFKYYNGGGITPLIDQDGKPIIDKTGLTE